MIYIILQSRYGMIDDVLMFMTYYRTTAPDDALCDGSTPPGAGGVAPAGACAWRI